VALAVEAALQREGAAPPAAGHGGGAAA